MNDEREHAMFEDGDISAVPLNAVVVLHCGVNPQIHAYANVDQTVTALHPGLVWISTYLHDRQVSSLLKNQ